MANSFRDKAEKKRAAAANPAMMFISEPQKEEPARAKNRETPKREPKQWASTIQAPRAPQGREAKTRRLQLLLMPSLYDAVKERADAEGLSVNETISKLLQQALSE